MLDQKVEATGCSRFRYREFRGVDGVIEVDGADSSPLELLLQKEHIAERLKQVRPRKIVIFVEKGDEEGKTRAGIITRDRFGSMLPQNLLPPELREGNCLVTFSEKDLVGERGELILIHEIDHLREPDDMVKKSLLGIRGRFIDIQSAVSGLSRTNPRAKEVLLMSQDGIAITNTLIDYRLVCWQIAQGEQQVAAKFTDLLFTEFKQFVAKGIGPHLIYPILQIYLIFFAPFKSCELSAERGRQLQSIFGTIVGKNSGIGEKVLCRVLERGEKLAKITDRAQINEVNLSQNIFAGEELDLWLQLLGKK